MKGLSLTKHDRLNLRSAMDFDFSRQGNARVFTHFICREILVLRSEDVKLKDDVVEKRF